MKDMAKITVVTRDGQQDTPYRDVYMEGETYSGCIGIIQEYDEGEHEGMWTTRTDFINGKKTVYRTALTAAVALAGQFAESVCI
jgi:hypothetical protein